MVAVSEQPSVYFSKKKNIETVTVVISEIVAPDKISEYEKWITGINQAVKEFIGFLGVEIIRPRSSEVIEYVVILRFDNYQNLKQWQESEVCKTWLDRSRKMVKRETNIQNSSRLELWFTLPEGPHKNAAQPPYYKKVIIGILAVYPLVLLINLILAPVQSHLSYLLGVFLSVILISALMTYPVMPLLTKVFEPWLHPAKNKIH